MWWALLAMHGSYLGKHWRYYADDQEGDPWHCHSRITRDTSVGIYPQPQARVFHKAGGELIVSVLGPPFWPNMSTPVTTPREWSMFRGKPFFQLSMLLMSKDRTLNLLLPEEGGGTALMSSDFSDPPPQPELAKEPLEIFATTPWSSSKLCKSTTSQP